MSLRIDALVPAYNEAARIGDVVKGLAPFARTVLVVDDGSIDGTGERARAAGADVLALTRNEGKGTAIRAGLARLLAGDCTHVLLIDGDMQHLPSELPLLASAVERTGADLVIGERRFERDAMPAARYHANRIGSRVLSWFIGTPLRDTQCGFRLLAAETARELPLKGRGYDIETEMLVKVARRGGRIEAVPVTAVYHDGRSKLRPVRDTTRTCFLAVYYRFLEPLR